MTKRDKDELRKDLSDSTVSISKAAEILSLSPSTVRQMTYRGDLTVFELNGRMTLHRDDVVDLREKREEIQKAKEKKRKEQQKAKEARALVREQRKAQRAYEKQLAADLRRKAIQKRQAR